MGPNRDPFVYYRSLRRVREFVERHYGEDLTLARVASYERKYFSARFVQVVGERFSRWLSRFRIERAADLLRQEDLSIGEILFQVGFRDRRTFERAFRRHMGSSASEFRRRVWQDEAPPDEPVSHGVDRRTDA